MKLYRGFPILLLGFALLLAVYFLSTWTKLSATSSFSKFNINNLYRSWKECISKGLEPLRGNHTKLWSEVKKAILDCDKPYVDILGMKRYDNLDDQKYHIHPLKKTASTPSKIVSLGIGHDIKAEVKLRERLGGGNIEFYGADPMTVVNRDLFSTIGRFYPLAVGSTTGFSTATVLMGHTFFDSIWLDTEGSEYEIFPLIKKGKEFDKAGIVVCQWNLEIHSPDDVKKKMIHDFLFQTLDDERYAYFLPVQVDHLRLFMVNFADERCVKKYVPTTP